MVCRSCQAAIPESAAFCPSCGRAVAPEAATISGVDDATRAAATPGARPASGWLSSSASISHGRFDPGTVFDGRYRIVGLLGRGGMGEVYRADDLRLGQQVALKLLPEDLRRHPQRLAQFHNEVRIARQIAHPNVCRVYDIGETNGHLYLSMKYVDGEDLASSLRRIGRFPEDRGVEIARQLCAGIAAAHQRGVIHRDLKPANIMLDGGGRVRIMDFGLAAVGDVDNVREGTPAYMAPEQLAGREVTARSDIFALGLILYELFTGRRAFTAATILELTKQHELRSATEPSAIVTALDPAIDRAILRCLEPEPDQRPQSALAVAAALPGADPLAAALAAGETPSPEIVAAAGEAAAIHPRTAWLAFLAIAVGLAISLGVAVRESPLELMRPELGAEVLSQKARDAITALGYPARGRDEAFSFEWNSDLIQHVRKTDTPSPNWPRVLADRPSPLEFHYRRSDEALTAFGFHNDLLTPGLVTQDDPPAIRSGMIRLVLDHTGRLLLFEAIPPERETTSSHAAPVDWSRLFSLAGLDPSALQPADPVWNWLAASDTRAAWTSAWPGSQRELRVEAAALGGRPVAFQLTGPWTEPSRDPEPSSEGQTLNVAVIFVLAFSILFGAAFLARRNLQDGRGDRARATRLAVAMAAVLMALWACTTHLTASIGLVAMSLIAICTSSFYGILLWTIYVALEPFVRRYWPRVLVSWTNVVSGRLREPSVARDVLFGTLLGVLLALLIRGTALLKGDTAYADFPGAMEALVGLRSTLGLTLETATYAVRNVFLFFFLLFVLRVILRRAWIAALAFAGIFALLDAVSGSPKWPLDALTTLFVFGSGAFAVLRWGILPYVVATFTSQLLLDLPVTRDASAWYFGDVVFMVLIVVALAVWGLYGSMAGPARRRRATT